jgi:hypothetical protein
MFFISSHKRLLQIETYILEQGSGNLQTVVAEIFLLEEFRKKNISIASFNEHILWWIYRIHRILLKPLTQLNVFGIVILSPKQNVLIFASLK